MSERMVQMSITLPEEQHKRLKALSARTRVPIAEYIREGISRVLYLAETQMATLEKVIAKERAE